MINKLGSMSVFLYVTAVSVAGLVAAGGLIARTPAQEIAGPSPWTFFLFAVLLVMSELRPMDWLLGLDGGEITISWSFAFALALIASPAGALAVMGLASALGDLLSQKPLSRILFNASQIMLSLGAGVLVIRAFHLDRAFVTDAPLPLLWLPGAFVAATIVFLTNGVLISLVLALHQRRPIPTVMRTAVGSNLALDAMLLALAPVLVITAQRSLTLVPLLVATIYAVYRSAYLAISRQHEATHDTLTELPNRRLFMEQAAEVLDRARRREESFAVVLVDLDGFKAINDSLGHSTGDRVLQEVAARLRQCRRTRDVVARIGGDEFALLLRAVPSPGVAASIARRALQSVSLAMEIDGAEMVIGGSFGIALFPDHGDDIAALVEHADVAMYAAKTNGGGVELYDRTRDRRFTSRLSMLADLRAAIDERQLILHYQPKLHLATGEVVGVEALVRWQHPKLGLVPPDDFVPLAESSDLVNDFTEIILDMALAQAASWARDAVHLPVAVNGSARNLRDPRFADSVAAALRRHGVEPDLLEIEITENMVNEDPQRTGLVLAKLRDMGVPVAIDDFGTGYSSLANLRNLPVDRIKIDRSFVGAMTSSRSDAMIVEAILALAQNLGLATVAEGVEDAVTLERLRHLGCDSVQGYGISRPLAPDDVVAWLSTRAPSREEVGAR